MVFFYWGVGGWEVWVLGWCWLLDLLVDFGVGFDWTGSMGLFCCCCFLGRLRVSALGCYYY